MTDAVIWVIALPLAGALLTVLAPRRVDAVGVATGLGTATAALALLWQVATEGPVRYAVGGWAPGLGIALHADGLAVALLVMTALVALAASLYATAYFSQVSDRARFWPLWLLLWTALNALFLAGDLFNLYVTLELLGLAAVGLTALGGKRAALEAALRYLVVGLVGSMAYLAGVVLIYTAYGTLDLAAVAAAIRPEPAAWTALALMTAGLLLKTALFPLHFWLPPAHANAPAPVSAALSALVVKAAFYLVLRLWLDLFAPVVTSAAANLLGLLGAAAVLWGSWQALRAERLKLVAAYSTVAQIGYLFLFFPLLAGLPDGPARDCGVRRGRAAGPHPRLCQGGPVPRRRGRAAARRSRPHPRPRRHRPRVPRHHLRHRARRGRPDRPAPERGLHRQVATHQRGHRDRSVVLGAGGAGRLPARGGLRLPRPGARLRRSTLAGPPPDAWRARRYRPWPWRPLPPSSLGWGRRLSGPCWGPPGCWTDAPWTSMPGCLGSSSCRPGCPGYSSSSCRKTAIACARR